MNVDTIYQPLWALKTSEPFIVNRPKDGLIKSGAIIELGRHHWMEPLSPPRTLDLREMTPPTVTITQTFDVALSMPEPPKGEGYGAMK